MKAGHKKIIEQLYFCEVQCLLCFNTCMVNGDKGNAQRCMQLTLDCAGICSLTAQALDRNSENSTEFMKLCAAVCFKCAAECRKHPYDHFQVCADACFKILELFSTEQVG